MNPLLMHFSSGNSLFSGCLLIILAVVLSFIKKESIALKISVNLLMLTGIIFIWLCSVPFWLKSEWLMFFMVFIFLVMFHFRLRMQELHLHILRGIILVLSLVFMIANLPYFLLPDIPQKNYKKLYLIGDSISGGVGFKGEKTWHEYMVEKYNIEVVLMAHGGARVEDVFSYAEKIKDEDALILLEIGGNDILRRSSIRKYEKNLDRLLRLVSKPERTVLMFGLPVPPFHPEIVSIQRRLSAEYGVILIPRRYFASMLTGSENSHDGLHLSNQGHERMGDMTWEIIQPLFAEEK